MSTLKTRYIPVLLIKNKQLYKTVNFNREIKYIGDPINALRIFNEKQVDEICILDIDASKQKSDPNFDFIRDLASECFMPMGYGGGIKNISTIEKLFRLGVEKVILNSVLLSNISLISEAANIFGSQSIVASVDVKKNFFGNHQIFSHVTNKAEKIKFEEYIIRIQESGAGELIINSVDKDGTMSGYDEGLIEKVSSLLSIPVVALGGAGTVNDLDTIISKGAHAAAAGSIFIYKGPHKAVLINYPTNK